MKVPEKEVGWLFLSLVPDKKYVLIIVMIVFFFHHLPDWASKLLDLIAQQSLF